jgi:small subunit ribosomal protein S6
MLMRHYEVTLIVHPDQSSQVTTMIEKYKELITSGGGIVHRSEDWGRKHLAYPINKIYKAHYLMMNIECDQETLDKLNYNFRFNDAVIRNLIISKSEAITSPSIMLEGNDKDKDEAKVKPKTETKVEAKADTEVKDDKKSEASDEVKE